jgi:hypothetical protein
VVLPKPAGAQISVSGASLTSIRSMSRARSTGVWGALGGENLLICGPFTGLGLGRGMGASRTQRQPMLRRCPDRVNAKGGQPHDRELLASPVKTGRRRSRVSVIFRSSGQE